MDLLRKPFDKKYQNWMKAHLAVKITKEGIEPFVYDEIEQFQQKCLTDICKNNGLPVGTTCSSCCTENVVVCPTNRICNAGRGRCNFHRNSATQYRPSGCPNKICHNFKNEIQRAHRFYGAAYKNTDATQWCSNTWEVAKCFMPPDGYKNSTSATETDFNGIIAVLMNYRAFQSKVHADLSKQNNIFYQCREVSTQITHCPSMQVSDADLRHYFGTLRSILTDPAYLASNRDAQIALRRLVELENEEQVSDDETRSPLHSEIDAEESAKHQEETRSQTDSSMDVDKAQEQKTTVEYPEDRRKTETKHSETGYIEIGKPRPYFPGLSRTMAECKAVVVYCEDGGLKVEVVHAVEKCERKSKNLDRVTMHYTGFLENGTQFDSR
ncbi:uncharacterized protein LOC128548219 [Mercenaria mercenaria]|uniref:uncharacterized protein LOC128548219 n=1 Tax=Mercenaria mercenaria TaxID=6596 RepID=UPI00234F8C6F|nr:uncharacterized protein LOC128548219 [Mercenaria mercenaria]